MASWKGGGRSGEGAQSLAQAVGSLAKVLGPEPEAPKESRVWKTLKPFVESLLPSVVMFVLGYAFIQGVELDLKREEFTASAADKLKSYVETLMNADPAAPKVNLRATALALGGFGRVAALPLISIIDSRDGPMDERRIAAAKLGLAQAGRVAPDATCPIAAAVIDDRTDAYQWETRKAIAEVVGLVGCSEAKAPLQQLKTDIEAMQQLDAEQRAGFRSVVEKALLRID